jgi:hypothetical protein
MRWRWLPSKKTEKINSEGPFLEMFLQRRNFQNSRDPSVKVSLSFSKDAYPTHQVPLVRGDGLSHHGWDKRKRNNDRSVQELF